MPKERKGKGKEEYLYSALIQRLVPMRSDMDHTVLPANYTNYQLIVRRWSSLDIRDCVLLTTMRYPRKRTRRIDGAGACEVQNRCSGVRRLVYAVTLASAAASGACRPVDSTL